MPKRVVIKLPDTIEVKNLSDDRVRELVATAAKSAGVDATELVIKQGDDEASDIGPMTWSRWTRSC